MENKRWVLLITSFGFFMSMMDSMIVTTASTQIREDFNISINTLQWSLNSYNITLAAILILGVSLGEKFGRRLIFSIGILIFTMGSIFCALSTNIELFIISRVIQGIGGSVMTPLSMAILANSISNEQRGKALGIWSGIGGLALIIGPSLGGLIVSHFSWEWIFWINVPIGIITCCLSLKKLDESYGSKSKINYFDASLITIASSALIFGISEFTDFKINMTLLFSLVIGVIVLFIFINRQSKQENPLIPITIFIVRDFRNSNIATFLLYASMYGMVWYFFYRNIYKLVEETVQ